MAKRDGSVCGLRVVVMRENKFGGEEGERAVPESVDWVCGGGVLIQGVRKSNRTRVFKIAMVLFCELHLGLTELDMRVQLFFHCWTMQSHLS